MWPGHGAQWGTERVLDRCNATHISRSFFAATDENCKTRTGGFDLPLGECVGLWGSSTCTKIPVFSWAALSIAVAASKTVSITLGDSFSMADYTGEAITIREGCSVRIISGAPRTVLDAGSKGTLFIVEGSLTLEGLTLKNGLAKEGNGGALTIKNTFTGTSCSFVNNTAPGGDGGVAHVYRNASAAFTSCSFINNTARAGGGAVDVYLGAARFVACSFQESIAGTDLKYNGIYAGFNVTFGCPAGTTGADVPLKNNANTSQLPPAKTIVSCQ
jgi:hypothetical protein